MKEVIPIDYLRKSPVISTHETYMKRCLQLAALAKGRTSPNPMVGAVIVHNQRIIGEGYHQKPGAPHAEVNAIASVRDKSLLKDSTLYVSLEPCSHFGKTPPCADLIIENQIPRVVIAAIDSNAVVCGNGISKLKAAGIEVITGVMEKHANALNKHFNTFHQKKRPFITLKWAQTSDGFIDKTRTGSSTPATQISSPASSRWVHQLRSVHDAILVGYQTALLDNPSLTTRKWAGKNPIRVVFDTDLSLPADLKLFTDGLPTIVINTRLSKTQDTINYIKVSGNPYHAMLEILYQHNIQSVLVEGGAKTLQQFIDQKLYDEVIIIKSVKELKSGVKAPVFSAKKPNIVRVETDWIISYFI